MTIVALPRPPRYVVATRFAAVVLLTSFLFGQQAPQFFSGQPSTAIDIGDAGANPRWCLGNFTGSGRLDLFVATPGSRAFSLEANDHFHPSLVLKNNPNLTFTDATPASFTSTPTKFINPTQIYCGDLAGDGETSVILADSGLDPYVNGNPVPRGGDGRPRIAWGNRAGGLMDGSGMFASFAPAFLHNLAAADIDGSGRPSLFFASITLNTVPQLSYLW